MEIEIEIGIEIETEMEIEIEMEMEIEIEIGKVRYGKYSLYWHVTNLQCILPKLQFHTLKKSI